VGHLFTCENNWLRVPVWAQKTRTLVRCGRAQSTPEISRRRRRRRRPHHQHPKRRTLGHTTCATHYFERFASASRYGSGGFGNGAPRRPSVGHLRRRRCIRRCGKCSKRWFSFQFFLSFLGGAELPRCAEYRQSGRTTQEQISSNHHQRRPTNELGAKIYTGRAAPNPTLQSDATHQTRGTLTDQGCPCNREHDRVTQAMLPRRYRPRVSRPNSRPPNAQIILTIPQR